MLFRDFITPAHVERLRLLRRQVLASSFALVCSVLILGSTMFAKGAEPEATTFAQQWITFPNIMAVLVLVFHFGAMRQRLSEIDKVQTAMQDRLDDVPKTFVTRELLSAELRAAVAEVVSRRR